MGLQGIKNIIHQRYNSIPAIHQIPENLSKWWGYILVVPKRICCRRLWQWSNAFVLMHQRKPFLHRTSNLKKRICAQRQTERGGATTASQCARKKNYCTTRNSLILFITTSSGHHNQPQSSITTYGCHHILPSTQMFPQLYVSNRHSVHGTLYTSKVNYFLEKIPRKDLWVWVSTEMCSHYWVTPPFDFITAHCITPYICPYYSSHNIHSICLCNCICTIQIVLVWALVSNFIIQPTDFQPTLFTSLSSDYTHFVFVLVSVFV